MAENKERRNFLKLAGLTSGIILTPSKIIASIGEKDSLSDLLGHSLTAVPKDIITDSKLDFKEEKKYSKIITEEFHIVKRRAHKSDRRIFMFNSHTGEHIDEIYWSQGEYINENLKKINYFMRDFREDRVKKIDKRTLNAISLVSHHTKRGVPLILNSAYRSARTNRRVGGARRSQHLLGKAIDFTTDKKDHTSLYYLKKFLIAHHHGGIGYYPRKDFIHVDAGPRRSWRG